jgi:hypothetical protein
MRIDKRFDDLVRNAPERFDVRAAADRLIRNEDEAVLRFPRKIDARVQLCYAYLYAGRYREVLREAGAVLSHVRDQDSFRRAYDEDETAVNWILDTYAQAALATEKWDEAVDALELAAQGLEFGKLNVSNVINLGVLYADLGRADKALRVLAEISEEHSDTLLSPVGRMQWHGARLAAALAKGDAARADAELEYLRAHQQDAPDAYQEGLLRSDHLEEAARLLIARLRDPESRREALLEVQEYDYPPAPPGQVRLRAQLRKVVNRPDVQQAIAKVGHTEKVPLPPP